MSDVDGAEALECQLPEEFFQNYAACRAQGKLQPLDCVGIWDLDEAKKADVIFLASSGMCAWFRDKLRREALVESLFVARQFFLDDAIALYARTGKDAGSDELERAGLFYSLALGYAIAKRDDVYQNALDYGERHFQPVADPQLQQLKLLRPLLAVALHLALLTWEGEQKTDPFDAFLEQMVAALL